MDLDDNNCVIGLEILDASEKLRDGLSRIELSGVPPWKVRIGKLGNHPEPE